MRVFKQLFTFFKVCCCIDISRVTLHLVASFTIIIFLKVQATGVNAMKRFVIVTGAPDDKLERLP
jgi:hypothetical protein